MDYTYLENVGKCIKTLIPNLFVNHFKIASDETDVFDDDKGLICCNGTKVTSKRKGNIFEVYLQSITFDYVHLLKIEKLHFDFTACEIKLLKKNNKGDKKYKLYFYG